MLLLIPSDPHSFAEPIAQGKAKAKMYLQEHPEIAKDLEAKLRHMIFEPRGAEEEVGDAGVGLDFDVDDKNESSVSRIEEADIGSSDSSSDDARTM